MPDRFGAIPEVHLFLLNDDRLLLLRRCNTDYENGNYSVIAGGVEADEEVTAAAIREATEEVGIDVRPGGHRRGGRDAPKGGGRSRVGGVLPDRSLLERRDRQCGAMEPR